MDPLTHEELDAIVKEAEIQSRLTGYVAASLFDRVADAARASIPRPIADAPRDGTYVAGCDPIGHWYACRWKGDEVNGQWLDSQGYERMLVEFIPIPGEGGV